MINEIIDDEDDDDEGDEKKSPENKDKEVRIQKSLKEELRGINIKICKSIWLNTPKVSFECSISLSRQKQQGFSGEELI